MLTGRPRFRPAPPDWSAKSRLKLESPAGSAMDAASPRHASFFRRIIIFDLLSRWTESLSGLIDQSVSPCGGIEQHVLLLKLVQNILQTSGWIRKAFNGKTLGESRLCRKPSGIFHLVRVRRRHKLHAPGQTKMSLNKG